eukprot:Awhi_evm1s6140
MKIISQRNSSQNTEIDSSSLTGTLYSANSLLPEISSVESSQGLQPTVSSRNSITKEKRSSKEKRNSIKSQNTITVKEKRAADDVKNAVVDFTSYRRENSLHYLPEQLVVSDYTRLGCATDPLVISRF